MQGKQRAIQHNDQAAGGHLIISNGTGYYKDGSFGIRVEVIEPKLDRWLQLEGQRRATRKRTAEKVEVLFISASAFVLLRAVRWFFGESTVSYACLC